jgi:hypothetical protein
MLTDVNRVKITAGSDSSVVMLALSSSSLLIYLCFDRRCLTAG